MRTPRCLAALLCAAAALTLSACGLSDLRPAAVADGITADERRRGRALLQRSAELHGLQAWRQARALEVTFTDAWPGWMSRTFFMPWQRSGEPLRLTVRPGTDDGRLEFLEGERAGTAWGVQDWVTYRVDTDGDVHFVDDDDIRFWIPTVAYFVELPFRLLEADVVGLGEQRTVDGRIYDRVFVSWKRAEPQPRIDQYVVWIARDSGHIDWLEYTVRDMMGSITGTMRYADRRRVGDLLLPFRMTVVDGVGKSGVMHDLVVDTARLRDDVGGDWFYPDPARRRAKHQD